MRDQTKEMMQYFGYSHLEDDEARNVSMKFHELASLLSTSLYEGPEKTACFRKLLEAKDCAVRSAMFE